MPELSGIDLIRNIGKIDFYNGNMKFILITAYLKEDLISNNLEKLNNIKLDRILEKPFRLEILKSTILEVLSIT